MDIFKVKSQLKNKFEKVKNVTFVKENNAFFLKVEVEEKNLNEITLLSKLISVFLDQIEKSEAPYFLDVFSSKQDMSIDKTKINNYLNLQIEVFLKQPLKEKNFFKGKLLENNGKDIKILWNAKGQFRKQIIPLENIAKIELVTFK